MINIKKILSIILAIITVITLIPTSVYALTWDGASTSGNNSAGSSVITGYAIRTSSDNCIGYRFSCVDANGNMKTLKVIDVFRNTGYGKLGYSDGYKFATKYNKKQLIAHQNSSFSTTRSSINCYKEADLGFKSSLPSPSGMVTWQGSTDNINIILNKLNLGSVNNLAYGDKVIVEPIYDLMLGGTYHSVTVTEYSVYGKYFLGGGSDGGSSATSNTWGFISKFTNLNYPNALYTPDGQGLWTAASALSSRATFNTIIAKGYGVGIAYSETTNKTYTIRFNGNGATSGSMKNQAMTYNVAKKLTANAFQKTGNAFSKWNTKADGSGTSYKNKQSVKNHTSTNGGIVDLFAQWSPYKLKVYYNANGGVISSDTYYKGESDNIYWIEKGTQAYQSWVYNETKTNGLVNRSSFGLTRTGYSYNHWGTSPTSGMVYNQDDKTLVPTSFTSDINNGNCSVTVYAQWIPIQYNIVFNGNGNTSGSTASMVCTYDQICNLTQNGYIKDGYHFVGWNTKPDGTGTAYMNKQSVLNLTSTKNDTITLYAQWETNAYTIGFDGNGHTGGSTSGMTMKFEEIKNLTANGYWRTGYEFKNWNTKADGSGAVFSNQQAVKNLINVDGGTVILYAQWIPIEYSIKFDGNGNTSGSTNGMTFKYDESKNLNANGYLKTGYNFVGWNTQKDGSGVQYANKQEVKNLTSTNGAVITLYAQWSPIDYTIKFDGNGATGGSTASMAMTYDETKNLTANGFIRASYKFIGWNSKADGTGINYTDKQSVKNLTTQNGATVTLYAKWEYDPVLLVNECDVYSGSKSDKTTLFGVSTGKFFDDYEYKTDYPTIGDTVWYNIYFPAEAESTQVRQYVKYNGGSWTTRDVMLSSSSTSSQWFPIQFTGNYKTITAEQQYFEIQAKTDWLDASGNILKSGNIKTFYIPIKPVVHRTQISATGYEGSVVAYNSPDGSSGKLYSGQHIKIAYKYTAENKWSATEYLRGSMYHYNGSSWTNAYTSNDGYDAAKNKVSISKSLPVTLNSSIGTYTVPVTSQNKLRFKLETWWVSDKENTFESTWLNLPVVRADVALSKITLVDANTKKTLDPNNLEVGQNVLVRYTYKNNTDVKVYTEGFKNDKTQISGVYAIPAKSSITVDGYTFIVPNKRNISIWGGVYLEGMGIYKTDYESNGNNNAMTLSCKVNHPLRLQPIAQNADYRESTEVITSFWLQNSCSDDYTPSEEVSIKFCVYSGSTLIKNYIKTQAVVPGNDYNLIYFKWKVPTGLNYADIKITGEIIDDSVSYNKVSANYSTTPYTRVQTPDTQFEKKGPAGFRIPDDTSVKGTTCKWWEYIYSNGKFIKTEYCIGYENNTIKITPANTRTATKSGSVWYMNSGYGITMLLDNGIEVAKNGYSSAPIGAYTIPQYAEAYFPEYSYATTKGKTTTLAPSNDKWIFPINDSYGNVHFTPLWYPDGEYIIRVKLSDLWTPAGMITSEYKSNMIKIKDSAYDDWYIGR